MRMVRLLSLGIVGAVSFTVPPALAVESISDRFLIPLEKDLTWPLNEVGLTPLQVTASQMGLIGGVKEVSDDFIVNNDDGSRSSNDQTVVQFFEDGRKKSSEETDLMNSRAVAHTTYSYDGGNRITRISEWLDIPKKTSTFDFSYDDQGHLTRMISNTDGKVNETVEVTNYPDGRPKEALQHLANGKAEWRLAYAYKDNDVTIDNFYDLDFKNGHTRATFQLDSRGRIQSAEVQRRDESGMEPRDFDGQYSYSYLPDGRKKLHAVETFPHFNPRPGPGSCTFDTAYFLNGLIDESTSLASDAFWCTRNTGIKTEEKFDAAGNLTSRRVDGKNVDELGRKILRWKYENIYDIKYY